MTPPLNLDGVLATMATPVASPKSDAVSDFAALVAAANLCRVAAPLPPAQIVEVANVNTPIVDGVQGDQSAEPPAAVLVVGDVGTSEPVSTVPADWKEKPALPEQIAVRLLRPMVILSAPLQNAQTAPAQTPDRPRQDETDQVAQGETPVTETDDRFSGAVLPDVSQVAADPQPKPTKESPKTHDTALVPQLAVRIEVRTEATALAAQPVQPSERRTAWREAEPVGAPTLLDAGPRASILAAARASDAGSSMPDRRAPDFSAQLMHLARDVVDVSAGEDVQFNVRPAFLGPVSVTIERRDDGPSLRLGVETQAAAQAVKQAEPVLTTSASPFVQVSVDLNSPGQRERSARTAAFAKRGREIVPDPVILQAAAKSGRFA
jgi:hypothetical protein